MADEFVYFLVGGLAIMAALMVLFSAGFGDGDKVSTSLRYGSLAFVGDDRIDNVQTLYATFTANNFLETNVYNIGSRRITNGLLFGESSIDIDVGQSDSVQVSFDVTGTNGYAPVEIKEDGKAVVQQHLAIGHYEFSLGPAKKVEIAVGSSEWRLWAPGLYDLENVRIAASGYPREISTYTFNLPEDVSNARMDFSLDKNAGALIMKLNGEVIYDGALNSRQSVFVDPSKFENVNILTFDARPDSSFAGRVTIVLTRTVLQEKQFVAAINLTSSEYARFDGGTISFDVMDVFSNGGYRVSIENNGVMLVSEYVKLERGPFELTIKKEHLRPGLNLFVVKSLDGSAFNVQNLNVRL